MSSRRKTYTVAIRMGAAHNDLCELPSRKTIVDLPAPVEAYRGRKPETEAAKARRQKAVGRHNAIMTKIGKDLCSTFGIEHNRGQKGKRKGERSVPRTSKTFIVEGIADAASLNALGLDARLAA